MMPYDYQTVGRLNRADRLQERDEIRLAKAVQAASAQLATDAVPAATTRPRARQWLSAMLVGVLHAVRVY